MLNPVAFSCYKNLNLQKREDSERTESRKPGKQTKGGFDLARQKDENREKAKQLFLDSDGLMKNTEIAEALGIDSAKVRKWKCVDKWNDALENKPKKRGGQKGNKNAKGHGAPVRNKNAETHGAYSKVYFDELSEDEKALIESVTLDTGENTLRELQSLDFVGAVIPIIANFIAGLMPIISELISFLQTYVLPIISELFSFITSTVLPTISSMIQAILPVVTNVLSVLLPTIQTALTTIWNIVAPIIQGILQVVQAVMPVILSVVQSVLGSVQGIIQNLMTVLQGIISFVTGVFTGNWSQAWNGIKSIFSGAVGGLGEIIKAPLRAVVSAVNTVIGGLNKLKVPDWVPGLGGKGINIPKIPGFAKGTDRTPGTFIAGENGPELITNAANRKVFTAAQTGQIFNNISQAQTADNVSARMGGAGTIVINVQNSPSVVVNGNGEANNIKQQLEQYDEAFLEKLRAIIVAILKEQKEQEDRVVYA